VNENILLSLSIFPRAKIFDEFSKTLLLKKSEISRLSFLYFYGMKVFRFLLLSLLLQVTRWNTVDCKKYRAKSLSTIGVIKSPLGNRYADGPDDRKIWIDLKKVPSAPSATSSSSPNSKKLSAVLPFLKESAVHMITCLFAFLLWRLVSVYDIIVSEKISFFTNSAKYFTSFLFFLNFVCVILQLLQPLRFKVILKSVLALDILREVIAIVGNLYSAFLLPPFRELYLGRAIGNVCWGLFCYSFSRSRWVMQRQRTTQRREQEQHTEQ
jgi:hypothetical protein